MRTLILSVTMTDTSEVNKTVMSSVDLVGCFQENSAASCAIQLAPDLVHRVHKEWEALYGKEA